MTDRVDPPDAEWSPEPTRVDSRQAQGVQVGNDGKQTNNFYNVFVNSLHDLVDVARKREPEHPFDECETTHRWWPRLRGWLFKGLRELAKTLWAPVARGMVNRPPSSGSRAAARAEAAEGRRRKRPSPKSDDAGGSQDATPTKPWERREVLGVVLWVGIGLLVMAQCQGPGVASTSPPNGSVQFSDAFDAGSPAWEIASAGQRPAPAHIDGALRVKSMNDVASVASTSAIAKFDGIDAVIEADIVRVDGEGQFGILCRRFVRGGRDNYYQFAIRDDGYVGIFKSHEDTPTVGQLAHWQPATALKSQRRNHVVAQCQNVTNTAYSQVQLNLWINGELSATASDYSRPLIRGTFALFSKADHGQRLLSVFDNLAIKKSNSH
jgi:hypothetical protein